MRLRSAGALAGELVPAVGPQVAAGVQLAEQLPGRVALDRDPQRDRAGRAGQPERRDLGHLDPSWSSRPRRMASPRAPPTSRWALRPRRYRMGKVSLGANSRNSTSGMVTPMAAPTSTSVGASAPRATRPSPASLLTAASSRTVTAGPRSPPAKTTIDSATSTIEATSQPTPLVCR